MSGGTPLRGERDLRALLAALAPALDPVAYTFTRVPGGAVPAGLAPLVAVREAEALTLVVPRADAERLGLPLDFLCRRIVLTVHSDLAAVGMMARVAAALAGAGIPCNVVAAAFHDHLFVPDADAEAALAALVALTQDTEGAVVYAVTVEVNADVAADWQEWMRTVHVPDLLATGCFHGAEMARRDDPPAPGGTVTYVIEYRARSAGQLRTYREAHAPALQQAHTARYGAQARATRTVRTVLAPPSRPE